MREFKFSNKAAVEACACQLTVALPTPSEEMQTQLLQKKERIFDNGLKENIFLSVQMYSVCKA